VTKNGECCGINRSDVDTRRKRRGRGRVEGEKALPPRARGSRAASRGHGMIASRLPAARRPGGEKQRRCPRERKGGEKSNSGGKEKKGKGGVEQERHERFPQTKEVRWSVATGGGR